MEHRRLEERRKGSKTIVNASGDYQVREKEKWEKAIIKKEKGKREINQINEIVEENRN